MEIQKQTIDIDSFLQEARRAADFGNVAASDSTLKHLLERATRFGVPLRESHLQEFADIQRSSRIKSIDTLLDQAECEADAGLVIDSEFTTGMIYAHAKEAAVSLTQEQEQRIRQISLTARVQAIDELIAESLEAANHGRIEFVDSKIERIFQYSQESGYTLSDNQENQVIESFTTVRAKALEQALSKRGFLGDTEALQEYIEETGLKLSKKQRKRLERG